MKNICLLGVAIFFLSACSQLKIDKDEAATAIRSGKEYPKPLEYDVNMTDPASARKLIDAGLEEEGFVTIDKTQKIKDIGQPIVHFTEKAKPYLIRIDSKYDNVQVVKVADIDLGEVTGISQLDDKKSADVEYTIVYKNVTPFSRLIERDLSKSQIKRVNLSLFDSGWKLNKNP
ncbi:MAG TPA: hypothetical protein VFI29_03270 [Hanamia sp.]|nr:hypothetical protein [Hanamia sp.]